MDYAAVIWHCLEDKTSPTVQQQNKFSTVQLQIIKTMLGCFHTTATDALENETSLLSPHPRLSEKFLKSISYIRPPWWSLKASIHIDTNKEIAETHHLCTTSQYNDNSAHIYTDGSGINDGIGAAMYCHTNQDIQ
jgi:hypothetical protein